MDQVEALLGSLRAKAALGTPRVDSATVEALANNLQIDMASLPVMVDQLQKRQPPVVKLIWGGGIEVLPQPMPGGGTTYNTTFYQQGARFDGAQAFGAHATGGTVNTGVNAAAIGALAEVVAHMAALRPTLPAEAAELVAQTERALKEQPASDAPPEARQHWVSTATGLLGRALQMAPGLKAAVEVAEKAVKALA